MPVAICRQFDGRRTHFGSARAAVVADAVNVGIVVDHGRVIGVVDFGDVHVIHPGIVEKAIVIPAPAFVTETAVTEAVIYAAVKADVRTPISAVPEVSAASPTPITGSPQESNPRPCCAMNLCQIEYVSSDGDAGTPCGKAPVAKCADCGASICYLPTINDYRPGPRSWDYRGNFSDGASAFPVI